MKKAAVRKVFALLVLPFLSFTSLDAAPRIDVHFSPKGGCTWAVLKAIDSARKSILVEAYSFTSMPIAKALVTAKNHKTRITVIMDQGQISARNSVAEYLSRSGIPVYVDSAFRIAHNKVMILDGKTVITGSFNFTKSAEKANSENLLVISNAPDLARKYTTTFQEHLALSQPYSSALRYLRPKHHHTHTTHFRNLFQSFEKFFHSLGI